MGLLTGVFSELLDGERQRLAAIEARSSLESPQTPLSYPAEWLLDIFNGGRTDSGIRVSELTAFQATYFLACVDLIAGSIAALPKYPYERKVVANGRVAHSIAYDHDLFDLIALEPNDEMSQFVATKAFMAHVLAWGNGYQEIQRDAGNRPVAFWPRNPYKTRPHRLSAPTVLPPEPWRPFPVKLAAGDLVYRTTDGIDGMDGSEMDAESTQPARFIAKEDMLHVPGLAFDGRIGQDVVWLARQTLGLALATEKFGAKYFANFAKPGGLLELPVMEPSAKEKAKQSWMEAQGGENAHRIAVMPPGTKWTPLSNNPKDSQNVELEDRLRNKICAMFHVPPRMVGDNDKGGKNSAEQDGQEFQSYTLAPWLQALRMEYKRKVFPSPGVGRAAKNRFYLDFDLSELQRPDATSREAFYRSGRQWGYLNTNDIRGIEKLNPIEESWAEDYWIPVNMTLTTTPLDPNTQDGAGNGDKDSDPADARIGRTYSRLFRDAFGRVCAREQRDLRVMQAAFGPILASVRDSYFELAKAQLRAVGDPGAESERFIAEYLGGMAKRAASWVESSAPEQMTDEVRRMVRAMRKAAWRDAAALKAMEGEE